MLKTPCVIIKKERKKGRWYLQGHPTNQELWKIYQARHALQQTTRLEFSTPLFTAFSMTFAISASCFDATNFTRTCCNAFLPTKGQHWWRTIEYFSDSGSFLSFPTVTRCSKAASEAYGCTRIAHHHFRLKSTHLNLHKLISANIYSINRTPDSLRILVLL